MAFYSPDPVMGQVLVDLVRALEQDGRPGLGEQLSITWVRYGQSQLDRAAALEPQAYWAQPWRGAGWRPAVLRYPASVVKLVYLVAAEAWKQRDWLRDDPELERALAAMVVDSSNNATEHVLDRLSGTTGGPALSGAAWQAWTQQRQLVNRWLQDLSWPELQGCNACQKTWDEGPYGRERQFYGPENANINQLTSDAVARLLQGVMASALVSPPACARMRQLLARSLDAGVRAADPENQIDGFLGDGLPQGTRLWSKAGWMSRARHDAAYIEADGHPPTLLVVMSEGEACARDPRLLAEIGQRLVEASIGDGP
ncbi:MAG: serine hydrolase [Cyanobacteriota bacterium]|nr:serine hydrolase [Cyanobacteriota bacterium]